MGNPLSPILADLVMEKLFKTCLPQLEHQPTLIKKYVDDIILAIPQQFINETVERFHSFDEHIKFTIEKEIDCKIPFLDMMLIRNETKINTCWYKKSTSSDRILNFISSHPSNMKFNIAVSFARRVFALSNSEFYKDIKETIINILIRNNYPKDMINKALVKARQCINSNNLTQNNNINQNSISNPTKFQSMTFVNNLTQQIIKQIKPASNQNFKLGYRIPNKTYRSFTKLKDKIPVDQHHNIVYEVPCQCGKVYVGETSNKLRSRLIQHQSDIRCKKRTTALAIHALDNNHIFKFNEVNIVHKEKNKNNRLVLESAQITSNVDKNINFRTDTNNLCDEFKKTIKLYNRQRKK